MTFSNRNYNYDNNFEHLAHFLLNKKKKKISRPLPLCCELVLLVPIFLFFLLHLTFTLFFKRNAISIYIQNCSESHVRHGTECITSIWLKVLVLFKSRIVEKKNFDEPKKRSEITPTIEKLYHNGIYNIK